MAFKLALAPTYEAEVTVEYPIENGGTAKAKFLATFKRLAQGELDEIRGKLARRELTDRDLVVQTLVDWKGVQDAEGADLPFNPGNLDKLLQLHPAQPSIVRAWIASVSGAREGN